MFCDEASKQLTVAKAADGSGKMETENILIDTPNTRGTEWDGLSSVQFSRSVVSDSLRPHGLQHARLPCPSPTPGAYSNSCPSSQ